VEVLFECINVQSRENVHETSMTLMAKKLIIHAIIYLSLALAFLVWVIINGNLEHMTFAIVIFISCFALVSYRYYNVPKIYAKQIYETSIKMYQEAIHTHVQFTASIIRNNNLQSRNFKTFQYKEITKLVETEHLYLLLTQNKSVIMLTKDGFVTGEEAQFIDFMKEKSSYLKLKLLRKK